LTGVLLGDKRKRERQSKEKEKRRSSTRAQEKPRIDPRLWGPFCLGEEEKEDAPPVLSTGKKGKALGKDRM